MLFSLLLACTVAPDVDDDVRLPQDATFEERVEAADAAFTGVVESVTYAQSSPGEGMVELPHTFVTWKVENSLKGNVPEHLTLRFFGGPLPDGRLVVPSDFPDFEVGDHDVLLVDGRESGCPLVDCAAGRFRLLGDKVVSDNGNLLTITEDGHLRPGPVMADPRLERVRVGQVLIQRKQDLSPVDPSFLSLSPTEFQAQVVDAAATMSGRNLRPILNQDASKPFFLEGLNTGATGSMDPEEANRRLPLHHLPPKR